MTASEAAFQGLTTQQAEARLRTHGPNELPPARRPSLLARAARQFRSPLIYILLFALVFQLALWLREGARDVPLDILSIAALLVVNAVIGVVQDYRSDAALDRLRAMASPTAWTLRDGKLVRVPTRGLVPGDVVRVEAGDRVHADARMLSDAPLLLDESIVTGESVPVERGAGDEIVGGAVVLRGRAHAEVTRTGASSAIGRIAHLLAGIDATPTPLERKLDRFGRQVARLVLVAGLLLVGVGLWLEGTARFGDVVIFAVALAVAVVPEELPAVLALTLALGVERMARRKALVRRLSAVEALGSVTVIATDKTGTLTENRMRVASVELLDAPRALRCMALASDADPATRAGDPLELALLDRAAQEGLDVEALRRASPRADERPFDSQWKFMRVTVQGPEGPESLVKGAPEAVLARCRLEPSGKARWLARVEASAAEGHKVIAFAWAPGLAEEGLAFLGFASLWDPPKPEVPAAVRKAQEAGVRVVMVTGDHPATALAVARAVGIRAGRAITGDELDAMSPAEAAQAARACDVFARVTPERKLRLVEALQADGEVVAMTGDGVNDAPALKKADVGVAMGRRGSEIAREAASLVLLDDDFGTIVAAIEEGRGLYENVQKFLRFMLTIHAAFFLLVVGGAIGSYALGLRSAAGDLILPLTALQILWINFLADGPPSFALGVDPNPGVMREPPRDPAAPLLDAASARLVGASALVKAAGGFALLLVLPAWGYAIVATQTAIFAYEYLGQLVFSYPVRRLRREPGRNRALHVANLLGAAILVALLALPVSRGVLGLAPPDAVLLAAAGVAVLLSWLFAEGITRWLRRRAHSVARLSPRGATVQGRT